MNILTLGNIKSLAGVTDSEVSPKKQPLQVKLQKLGASRRISAEEIVIW